MRFALWRRPLPLLLALFVSHVLVFVVPVGMLVIGSDLMDGLDRARHEGLARQADLAALLLKGNALHPDAELILEIADRTHAGVRVLDVQGAIVASNGPRLGDDLSGRPEVQAALGGATGLAVREMPPQAPLRAPVVNSDDPTGVSLQRKWLYVASPLREGDRVVGAVLLTRPSRHEATEILLLLENLGEPAIIAGVMVLVLALAFSWRLSRSLHALAAAVGPLADGRREAIQGLEGTRVAEVRTLVRTFMEVTDRLRAQLLHNRDFAANVAHEFKTPITTLRGTIELFAEEPDQPLPPAQRQRFIENARTDLLRLERMVQGLLDLARAEAAQPEGVVDLDALLAREGPPFTVVGQAGPVRGDARLLEVALRNLLDNAQRHGGPPIYIRAFCEGDWVGFSVVDGGPGISVANQSHLFERFFTTSRGREGTGLGLALVRAVARAHGGDALVQSQAGETVVTVRLPLFR